VAVALPPAAIRVGGASVSVCWTMIGVEPLTPLTVTVMVAVPSATARTRPALDTVATAGLLLL
jgi:hypothetical protein